MASHYSNQTRLGLCKGTKTRQEHNSKAASRNRRRAHFIKACKAGLALFSMAAFLGSPAYSQEMFDATTDTGSQVAPVLIGYADACQTASGGGSVLHGKIEDSDTDFDGNTTDNAAPAGVEQAEQNGPPSQPLEGWLRSAHPEFKLTAQSDPMQVLEVAGSSDHMTPILERMGVRYQTIDGDALEKQLSSRTKVLLVNCGATIDEEGWARIHQWVKAGGYLITTDLEISYLDYLIPGMVCESHTGEFAGKSMAVHAVPAKHSEALLQGTKSLSNTWRLCRGYGKIKVMKPFYVHPILRQKEGKKGGQILAFQFNLGKGHVLHLVGHFHYVYGDMHMNLRKALATNFVIAGLES